MPATSYHSPQVWLVAAALLLCGAGLPGAAGQPPADREAMIARLIADLDADDFRVRQAAGRQLQEIGDAAVSALQELESSGTLEQQLRARLILERVLQNSFVGRLSHLQDTLTITAASRLPCWDRFADLVGTDPEAIQCFVQLLQAEPQLFTICLDSPTLLPNALRDRVTDLQEALSPAAQVQPTVSPESLAAILLIASDQSVRLPGATSTIISSLALSEGEFQARLQEQQADSAMFRRLAGAWVLRDGIAPQRPLLLAKQHRLPEGPVLARRVLKTALRGTNGWYALVLLAEQGAAEDLPLLESLLDNHAELYSESISPSDENAYRVEVCDVALAVALKLRQQDLVSFGFPKPGPGREFTFSFDLTGFASPAARTAAVQKYRDLFLQ